ncbi:MAG: polysulfide reductase NrfD [Bryobacteraceae bacterium]|nr:polysulfide reductase NrfD [Bryobacteraceae bacterium]
MVSALDRAWIPRGVVRAPLTRFGLWVGLWLGVFAVGAYAMYLCLADGLFHTNMDNRYVFGLWIFLDLTVIALGAGAFFTGFLLYVLRKKELKAVINSAVVLGLICYSGAMVILAVDVGQPLRAWFTYWYPNAHSMLAEVTFCITCYLLVLCIEYVPILLKNRRLRGIGGYLVFEHELHKLMVVFALIGTLLSFFHQGSLGGLFGVLRGRPFAFREGFAIWPSTFFLFILSAIAAGPSFIALTTWLVEKISRRRLISAEAYDTLARISGKMLMLYVLMKSLDTLFWLNQTAPARGFPAHRFYEFGNFGGWTLFIEIVILGLLPGLALIHAPLRAKRPVLLAAALAACAGVTLNRFVLTIQTMALPTLPFDRLMSYWPSWQEFAAFGAVVAYGVLVYSFSFRYLTLFPQERELTRAELMQRSQEA